MPKVPSKFAAVASCRPAPADDPALERLARGFNNGTPGQDGRRNIVRYDSPEFGGFVASASWGEDDLWDTSLTYKGEIHDFKLIGKIGYGESTDPLPPTAAARPAISSALGGALPPPPCINRPVFISTAVTVSRRSNSLPAVR